jgi:hypothetical protein
VHLVHAPLTAAAVAAAAVVAADTSTRALDATAAAAAVSAAAAATAAAAVAIMALLTAIESWSCEYNSLEYSKNQFFSTHYRFMQDCNSLPREACFVL